MDFYEPNVRNGTSCIKGRVADKPELTETDRKFNFHRQV